MPKANNFIIFSYLVIFTLILGFLSKTLLNTNDLIVNTLAEQMSSEQLIKILDLKEKWEWIGYCLIPVFLMLKTSVITVIIDIGCFFFDKEIKYKKLFNIVTKAEYVFLGVIILKTIWFYVFQQNYTLEDLQYFYPLSTLNIVGFEGLQSWFIYPFQTLNLFELAYWFILAYLLGKELKITTDKCFSIVASSYGVALLIWVVGIMFFTLNVS